MHDVVTGLTLVAANLADGGAIVEVDVLAGSSDGLAVGIAAVAAGVGDRTVSAAGSVYARSLSIGVTQSVALGSAADRAGLGSGAGGIRPIVTQSSGQLGAADGANLSVLAVSSSAGGVTLSVCVGILVGSTASAGVGGVTTVDAIGIGHHSVISVGQSDVVEVVEALTGTVVHELNLSGSRLSGEGDVHVVPSVGHSIHVDTRSVVVVLCRSQSGVNTPGGERLGETHEEGVVGGGTVAIHLEGQGVLLAHNQVLELLHEHIHSRRAGLKGLDDVTLAGAGGIGHDLHVGAVGPLGGIAGLPVTIQHVTVVGHGAAVEGNHTDVVQIVGTGRPASLETQVDAGVVTGVEDVGMGLPSSGGGGVRNITPVTATVTYTSVQGITAGSAQDGEDHLIVGVLLNGQLVVGVAVVGGDELQAVVAAIGLSSSQAVGGHHRAVGGPTVQRAVLEGLGVDGVLGEHGIHGNHVIGNLHIVDVDVGSLVALEQQNQSIVAAGIEDTGVLRPLGADVNGILLDTGLAPRTIQVLDLHSGGGGSLHLKGHLVVGVGGHREAGIQVLPALGGPLHGAVFGNDGVDRVALEFADGAVVKVVVQLVGGADRDGGHGNGGAQQQHSSQNSNDFTHVHLLVSS